MPMIYADEADAALVMGWEKDAGEAMQGNQMGSSSFFKDISARLGLFDPLKRYEPGKKGTEVFKKYSGWIDYHEREIEKIRSEALRVGLLRTAASLKGMRKRLRAAYGAPGAVPGERDRKLLGMWVLNIRRWRRDFFAAKREYGQGAAMPPSLEPMQPPPAPVPLPPVPAFVPVPPAPPVPAKEGIPTELLVGGAAAVLLVAVLALK